MDAKRPGLLLPCQSASIDTPDERKIDYTNMFTSVFRNATVQLQHHRQSPDTTSMFVEFKTWVGQRRTATQKSVQQSDASDEMQGSSGLSTSTASPV